MTPRAVQQRLTLEEFLTLPETKPASEFGKGEIWQKPMPQGEHSCLQVELCRVLNQVGQPAQIAYAFSELRCSFGGRSLVPDVSVFRWDRIPRTETGRVANRFLSHPDWAIEILSPGQRQTKVLENLLHCSEQGTELGWLLDAEEEMILVVDEAQRVRIVQGEARVPTLPELGLSLTVAEVFGWLML